MLRKRRLREARLFSRPKQSLRFKSNSGKWKELWIPLGSLLVALLTTTTALVSQYQNTRLQVEMKSVDMRMKEFETTFKAKQEAYALFMKQIELVVYLARNSTRLERMSRGLHKADDLYKEIETLDELYYRIEPFIGKSRRNEIRGLVFSTEFSCLFAAADNELAKIKEADEQSAVENSDVSKDKPSNGYQCTQGKNKIREELLSILFGEVPLSSNQLWLLER